MKSEEEKKSSEEENVISFVYNSSAKKGPKTPGSAIDSNKRGSQGYWMPNEHEVKCLFQICDWYFQLQTNTQALELRCLTLFRYYIRSKNFVELGISFVYKPQSKKLLL